MKVKKDTIFVWIFVLILSFISIIDCVKKNRFFSESENRILAGKPVFKLKEFLEGDYGKEYEEYISDQFLFRENWISLKTYTDLGLRKKEINGVFYTSENILFEKHEKKELDKQAEEKLEKLKTFTGWCDGKYRLFVMLIPTADAVYTEKLPEYAVIFEQKEYLNKVKNVVGKEHFVDVEKMLKEHKEEYIYYRTDHHWTTLGAFYGYQAWAKQAAGKSEEEISMKDYTRKTVTDEFFGTLQRKINIPIKPDSVEIFLPKEERQYEIYYDFKEEAVSSFYEKKYLEKKDKYSLFFGGNHDFIEIRTGNKNKKNILVIKDSYANCFLPFLTEQYENIYVVDFRYYRGNVENIVKQYDVEDILVLYNVVQFAEEFRY